MVLRSTLLLLPLAAFAQTPDLQPPPEVDRALRARVTGFFQALVDAKFYDAFDYVAADTKDYYFNSGKTPLKEFKITDIKYESGFEKAAVKLDVKRLWSFSVSAQQDTKAEVDVPMITTWKLENGKWLWSSEAPKDAWVTPVGPSDVPLLKKNADGTIGGLPPKLTQDTIMAAAQKILQQSGADKSLDKSEITLAADKASSEKVVFHNGAQGSVHLEVHAPQLPGLSAKLDKVDVNFEENATLLVSYEPPSDAAAIPNVASVYLVLVPFDQRYEIKVNFGAPKK
ncbi:MAG TPA: hypothetical protein VEV85_27530 [Bryobacteraceae bacterium]|nr:hypothetical protein [Bryobacteraceae bacterium]